MFYTFEYFKKKPASKSCHSKIFEKLANNMLVDQLDSTAFLLIVVAYRIARAFKIFGVTQDAALDTSKTFVRV